MDRRKEKEKLSLQEHLQLRQKGWNEPLISKPHPINNLLPAGTLLYSNDAHYAAKVDHLASKYQAFVHLRPGKDCFFRAFTFAYLRHLVSDTERFNEFLGFCEKSQTRMQLNGGFPIFTWKEKMDTHVALINKIKPKGDDASEDLANLHETFVRKSFSLDVIELVRLMVSCQPNRDDFDHSVMRHFVMYWEVGVERRYKAQDYIHIGDICSAFGIGIRIEYTAGPGDGSQVITRNYPNDAVEPDVVLLYRPGRYDVLYPHDEQQRDG